MHIEIFEGKDGWHWHFKNKGRIVADAEAFASKSNAVRAAKGVVKSVMLRSNLKPQFSSRGSDGMTVITWSCLHVG